ncbi:alcohol dehydrogenase catalytic domain-containing protein [Streptomyces sp. NPDC020096]
MKAVVYRGPATIAVEDRPIPALAGPRDAIVKVTATAVCGTDLHPYRGELPQFEAGTVLGHEFAGTVVESGEQVPYGVGQRVFASDVIACGRCAACARGMHYHCASAGLFGSSTLVGEAVDGGQAEYVRVPFADVVLHPTPEGVSDEQAVFVGDILSTAYAGVQAAGIRPGDTVAVVGAGPVGILAAACARAAGAAEVVLADPDPRRRNSPVGRVVEPHQLSEEARELTGGWGAHAVIEAVGSPSALRGAIEAVAPKGTVAALGVHHAEAAPFPSNTAFAKEATLRFVVGDPVVVREPVLSLIRAGLIDPTMVISHRLPLSSAAEAYALFDAREATKVVLTTTDSPPTATGR